MSKVFTTVVVVVTAAVMLAGAATAGPSAAKQRVAIRDSTAGFVLTPLTAGRVKADAGSATFCCTTSSYVITRDGQTIEITNGPTVTLVGQRGTLQVRNRMEWLDVSGGYQLFTGTWTVVRGTGTYAGLAGGGRVAGIKFPNGDARWRREGLLGPKASSR